MAEVTLYPSSNTAVSGTWSNPTNAYSNDDADVSITRGTTKNSQDDRRYGTFGADGQIPAGSTITDVKLEVEHYLATTNNICFLECAVRVSGVDGSFNSDSTEPTTRTARSYPAQARPGGGGWARADLLDAAFEVTLRARNGNSNASNTWNWDYVRVVVTYTPPGALIPPRRYRNPHIRM